MASPPFSIDETLPAASDLISQHPANARTFRDVVESWLLTLSDTDGNIKSTALADAFASLGVALPGMVNPYAGSSAPTGWLLCDGSAVSRTTYADLFAVVGTTYGVGDGSTTFNLPDLRGRVPAGKDNMGGSAAGRLSGTLSGSTLGATGGAESVTLSTSHLPAHSHSVTGTTNVAGNHTHSNGISVTNTLGAAGAPGYAVGPAPTTANGAHSHSVTGTAHNTGGGTAHLNVQPTIVLNYIIKT